MESCEGFLPGVVVTWAHYAIGRPYFLPIGLIWKGTIRISKKASLTWSKMIIRFTLHIQA